MRHWFLTRPDNSETRYVCAANTDTWARAALALSRCDVREWVIVSARDRGGL